jgi:hypothetical protein
MRLAGAHKDSSFVTHLLGKTLYRSKVLSGLVQAVQKRGFKNVALVDPKQAFGRSAQYHNRNDLRQVDA